MPEVTEKYIRIPVSTKKFIRIRTITISAAKGIKALIGVPAGGKGSQIKTYLFDRKKWTMARARAWIAAHKSDSLCDIILFSKLEDQARNDYLDLEEYTSKTFRIELKKGEEFSKAKIVALNKAQGIQAVFGYRGEFDNEIYAYIFNKDFWTEKTARAWIVAHKNDSLNDLVLFGKLEEQAKAKERKLADRALIKKLEDQAKGKRIAKHTDSIGVKGDSLEIDAWTETNEGVTFHNVVFAKEMVQQYPNGKHYKPAEELRKALDSLRGKPITGYVHPPEKIVTNMGQQVGYIVFDSVKWDKKGKRPYGDVFIKKEPKNKQLIKDTKQGRLEDVSVGFRCTEVHSPGTFMGEHYDIRQENFFFDHLALVMQGRAGSKDGVGLNAF